MILIRGFISLVCAAIDVLRHSALSVCVIFIDLLKLNSSLVRKFYIESSINKTIIIAAVIAPIYRNKFAYHRCHDSGFSNDDLCVFENENRVTIPYELKYFQKLEKHADILWSHFLKGVSHLTDCQKALNECLREDDCQLPAGLVCIMHKEGTHYILIDCNNPLHLQGEVYYYCEGNCRFKKIADSFTDFLQQEIINTIDTLAELNRS